MVHALWLEGGAIAPKAPPPRYAPVVCVLCQPVYVFIDSSLHPAWLCLGGWSPEAYSSRFFFTESFPELILCVCWKKLSTVTCNASLTQYYLEMKLVDFGLMALLWSYSVIYIRLLTIDGRFSLFGVSWRATCLQRTAFQLCSSICTTRQTMS